ncbi:unnamed protein product [Vitrella brassicaformis CCMP3155]|uniref:CBM20 domain-containing protein n=1 Tax=Vitrella brassicaformis (strain CCMP3155) TaxID=1169540 RepID=A0A0G4EXN0_VITBC|nr:unnamed protein product [Vitrella brassicaformis CCMP3155]|eukprot:CEM03476.1 unnamed protein product [Vitrella brassicaformis CCMP3155]
MSSDSGGLPCPDGFLQSSAVAAEGVQFVRLRRVSTRWRDALSFEAICRNDLVDLPGAFEASSPLPGWARIRFVVTCADTQVGQDVRLVGSSPLFGSWTPKQGLPMSTDPSLFPRWQATIDLAPDSVRPFSYKYVIYSRATGEARWEERGNREMPLQSYQHARRVLTVRETFDAADEGGNVSVQRFNGWERRRLAMRWGAHWLIAAAPFEPQSLLKHFLTIACIEPFNPRKTRFRSGRVLSPAKARSLHMLPVSDKVRAAPVWIHFFANSPLTLDPAGGGPRLSLRCLVDETSSGWVPLSWCIPKRNHHAAMMTRFLTVEMQAFSDLLFSYERQGKECDKLREWINTQTEQQAHRRAMREQLKHQLNLLQHHYQEDDQQHTNDHPEAPNEQAEIDHQTDSCSCHGGGGEAKQEQQIEIKAEKEPSAAPEEAPESYHPSPKSLDLISSSPPLFFSALPPTSPPTHTHTHTHTHSPTAAAPVGDQSPPSLPSQCSLPFPSQFIPSSLSAALSSSPFAIPLAKICQCCLPCFRGLTGGNGGNTANNNNSSSSKERGRGDNNGVPPSGGTSGGGSRDRGAGVGVFSDKDSSVSGVMDYRSEDGFVVVGSPVRRADRGGTGGGEGGGDGGSPTASGRYSIGRETTVALDDTSPVASSMSVCASPSPPPPAPISLTPLAAHAADVDNAEEAHDDPHDPTHEPHHDGIDTQSSWSRQVEQEEQQIDAMLRHYRAELTEMEHRRQATADRIAHRYTKCIDAVATWLLELSLSNAPHSSPPPAVLATWMRGLRSLSVCVQKGLLRFVDLPLPTPPQPDANTRSKQQQQQQQGDGRETKAKPVGQAAAARCDYYLNVPLLRALLAVNYVTPVHYVNKGSGKHGEGAGAGEGGSGDGKGLLLRGWRKDS